MTTARRRKASNRSVAIRRVKSRKSQNAKRLKTFRRKTRNVVMRGGASDLSLYYEPAISPPRCIIIKKDKVFGRRDPLYLFFANNLTLDEINEYVRSAMGLEASATFDPQLQFIAQPNTNTYLRLTDLFVKLSGIIQYSSIESGYLQRTTPQEDKALDTSKTHKIEMTGSPQTITKWEQVLDNLDKNGHKFIKIPSFSQKYNIISSYVAADGYSLAIYKQEWDEEDKISRQNSDCDKQINKFININIQNNITAAIKQLSNWPDIIRRRASALAGRGKSEFIKEMNESIRNFDPSFVYDSTIRGLRDDVTTLKEIVRYDALSDVCKQRFDERYNISHYKTIEEIFDDTHPKQGGNNIN